MIVSFKINKSKSFYTFFHNVILLKWNRVIIGSPPSLLVNKFAFLQNFQKNQKKIQRKRVRAQQKRIQWIKLNDSIHVPLPSIIAVLVYEIFSDETNFLFLLFDLLDLLLDGAQQEKLEFSLRKQIRRE